MYFNLTTVWSCVWWSWWNLTHTHTYQGLLKWVHPFESHPRDRPSPGLRARPVQRQFQHCPRVHSILHKTKTEYPRSGAQETRSTNSTHTQQCSQVQNVGIITSGVCGKMYRVLCIFVNSVTVRCMFLIEHIFWSNYCTNWVWFSMHVCLLSCCPIFIRRECLLQIISLFANPGIIMMIVLCESTCDMTRY